MSTVYYIDEEKTIRFECPRCKVQIEVKENDINCKIFRCGVFKSNFLPIYPHLSLIECEKLIEQDKIYGCGASLELVDKNIVVKCDYSK